MTWITEEPFWLILMFLLLAGCGIIAAFGGGGRGFGIGAAACVGFAIGIFFIEQAIETDQEKLRKAVYGLATEVRNNNVEGAIKYFDPKNQVVINRVRNEMPGYEFRVCNVLAIKEVEIRRTTKPKQAKVEFVVFFRVNAPSFGYDGPGRRQVVLRFEQDSNHDWKVVGYHHFDPKQREFYEARQVN